ncbi:Hypothetical protein NCS54_00862200 [Fusarium falciforme]|uniref:Hypothetical protein n=1 Tax=Fusarium falciforme TaxID=195108 RepID=UPI002300828E|nr:Hypothetical protein NCS54_00862200 [Fusarium falciforme]WAO91165.1 Hypothetical protein NCS54_00862200 [Fusarium falciforme]
MHKAFTLTQKRRARDKMAKRCDKLVDAAENVWPRNTGSIGALVRRTLARTGIVGSRASRFVVPAKTKYQKQARKSAKRMQGLQKEFLRKVNDPTDAMDMEHAIQELCDTSPPPVKQQTSPASDVPPITNTDAPPSRTRPVVVAKSPMALRARPGYCFSILALAHYSAASNQMHW